MAFVAGGLVLVELGQCHTLILDLKILCQVAFLSFLIFSNSLCFYCASTAHITVSVF